MVIGPHACSISIIYIADDELARIIHALTRRSVPVTFITDDLTTLGIDVRDIPPYMFHDGTTGGALYSARSVGFLIYHWD